MGLDVTHQVLSNTARVARIAAIDNKAAQAAAGMLGFFSKYDTSKYGVDGAPLHDPCTVAFLLEPGLFRGKVCNVAIETGSELTMGNTAVDFWQVTDRAKNANWLYQVDAVGFFALLIERLKR